LVFLAMKAAVGCPPVAGVLQEQPVKVGADRVRAHLTATRDRHTCVEVSRDLHTDTKALPVRVRVVGVE
jgi:hypothetical protein